jgi:hypothetical protein
LYNLSKHKTILFSILATGILFICLEATARVVLSLKKNTFAYIAYGLIDIKQKQLLQRFEDKNGWGDYYKSVPSADKQNPVNSLGFRGPEILQKKYGTIQALIIKIRTPQYFRKNLIKSLERVAVRSLMVANRD